MNQRLIPGTEGKFLLADPHDNSPSLSRANFDYEEEAMKEQLQGVQSGLQVGCMNGTRVVRFSQEVPGVHIDGLELSKAWAAIAKNNVKQAGLQSKIYHGDITDLPKELDGACYDVVYALNNTLGYIPDVQKTLDNMRALSVGQVVLSLFSDEHFTDDVALSYFASMEIDPNQVKIVDNTFYVPDGEGVMPVRRFTQDEVLRWGSEVRETPLGFYCVLNA